MTFPDYDTWSRLTASSKLLPDERAKIHQQISSEHEMVERLKAEYDKVNRFPFMGDITTGIKNKDLTEIFKSILEIF